MRPLELGEIVDRERYAALRSEYRDAVIAHKRRRRMALGEKLTLLFEDRETLRFQVQEMLWVEGIREPERIQHELDVYNELMPGPRELSATLFIEITETGRIRAELDRLVGIDECLALGLGEPGRELWIPARFDPEQLDEDRISAVHYLRFPLDEEQARRFAEPEQPARLRVDHPHYRREEPIPKPVREGLIADLAREPEPLLAAAGTPPPAAEIWFETESIRVLAPAGERGPVVVEPVVPVRSLLEADDALLAELLAAVKRAAAHLVEARGACRVQTDVGAGTPHLRFLLLTPDV